VATIESVAVTQTDVFRALADETRRSMLALLSVRPRTATEMGEPFAMSAPAVSQHLTILRESGLVDVERVGKYRVYKLVPAPLLEVSGWINGLERTWNRRLDRLERVVARLNKEQKRGRRGSA
jgi:DNA-binding transcriptional ArsR family regulator